MTLSEIYWFRLSRVGCLTVFLLLFGALTPTDSFGEPQSKTSTPAPEPSPTPSSRKNLSEYARGRDLQSSSKGQKTSPVITDENLEGFASATELTSVTGSKTSEPGTSAGPEIPRDIWRGRVKEQLRTIQGLEDDNKLVDEEISGLWVLFYACDEPDDREKHTRFRLNQKLDDRTRLRAQLKTAHSDFEELLVEARKSGALPGWFRDLMK